MTAAISGKTISATTLAVIIALVMIAVYAADQFLAAEEQSEMRQAAADHYAEGVRLLHAGKAEQAIAEFSRAHASQRTNREYELGLAEAQLASHRLPDATNTLDEALESDSNDGRANLLMARVLVAQGNFKNADSYYHRAVYGEWPPNAANEPSKVRLELANMLAEHGSSQELLSELLPLVDQPGLDIATRKQIARLLLRAGSPSRAAEAWRRLTTDDPNDIEAYQELAQAEVLAGDYRSAEQALFSALRKQPYNEGIHARLRSVVKLASLDPTTRRLTSAEKYRRSLEILRLVQAQFDDCTHATETSLPKPAKAPVTNEMAEELLDQAQTLWRERLTRCPQPPASDDPLPILMKKLHE